MGDDFERAVLVSLNPTQVSPQTLQGAQALLAQFKASGDAWKLCLQKAFSDCPMQVRFFCFLTLVDLLNHKHGELSAESRAALRQGLLTWLKDHLPAHPQEDTSVKNKFVQALVVMFKLEYPEEWPSFFSDLFMLLKSTGSTPAGLVMVDMFLRIMASIDQLVINSDAVRSSAEIAHASDIKEAMKVHCVNTYVEVCYSIIVTFRTSCPPIAKSCLDNLRAYLAWIELPLIVNNRFLPLFYELLSSEDLREEVCECLYEIVVRGMDTMLKLDLLHKLNLLPIISSIKTEDEDFQVKLAKLVNAIGVELIYGWTAIQVMVAQQKVGPDVEKQSKQMVNAALALMWQYLNAEDDLVSEEVVPLAKCFVEKVQKDKELTEEDKEHLRKLLTILANKMKYDSSYDFSKPDQIEQEFLQYRKELSNLFRKVVKLCPEMSVMFVSSLVRACFANISAMSFADVEVSLYLLGLLSDASTQVDSRFFSEMLVALVSSDVWRYPHRAVVLTAFETAVNYARYLPNDAAVISNFLGAFFGTSGMRSSDLTVRSRAAYMFFRLCRAQKNLLLPYLPQILAASQDQLVVKLEADNVLPYDSQLFFFNGIGLLLSATKDKKLQQDTLKSVVGKFLDQVEEILAKEIYKQDTVERPVCANFLQQVVAVVTALSSGFGSLEGQSGMEELLAMWSRTSHVALRIVAAIPQYPELRLKVLSFLHRMVESIGTHVLPYLPLACQVFIPILNSGSVYTSTDMTKEHQDFVRLITQAINRFKDKVRNIVEDIVGPVIQSQVCPLVSALAQKFQAQASDDDEVEIDVVSEEEREWTDMIKGYLLLIQSVLGHSLSSTLIAQKNGPYLEALLKALLLATTASDDISLKKQCVTTLRMMIEAWAGKITVVSDPNESGGQQMIAFQQAFNVFVFEHCVPLFFTLPLSPDFRPADAQCSMILGEMSKMQKTLVERCGQDALRHIKSVVCQIPNCSAQATEEYMQQLLQPLKQFDPFYKKFVQAARTQALAGPLSQ